MNAYVVLALGLVAIVVAFGVRLARAGRPGKRTRSRIINAVGECLSIDHRVNEIKNANGPHQCQTHCDCDGRRVCSAKNWCENPVE